MTYQQAREILSEHQQWRRGVGKYEWNVEPDKNEPMPYAPHIVGEAIDCALVALGAMAGMAKRKEAVR